MFTPSESSVRIPRCQDSWGMTVSGSFRGRRSSRFRGTGHTENMRPVHISEPWPTFRYRSRERSHNQQNQIELPCLWSGVSCPCGAKKTTRKVNREGQRWTDDRQLLLMNVMVVPDRLLDIFSRFLGQSPHESTNTLRVNRWFEVLYLEGLF